MAGQVRKKQTMDPIIDNPSKNAAAMPSGNHLQKYMTNDDYIGYMDYMKKSAADMRKLDIIGQRIEDRNMASGSSVATVTPFEYSAEEKNNNVMKQMMKAYKDRNLLLPDRVRCECEENDTQCSDVCQYPVYITGASSSTSDSESETCAKYCVTQIATIDDTIDAIPQYEFNSAKTSHVKSYSKKGRTANVTTVTVGDVSFNPQNLSNVPLDRGDAAYIRHKSSTDDFDENKITLHVAYPTPDGIDQDQNQKPKTSKRNRNKAKSKQIDIDASVDKPKLMQVVIGKQLLEEKKHKSEEATNKVEEIESRKGVTEIYIPGNEDTSNAMEKEEESVVPKTKQKRKKRHKVNKSNAQEELTNDKEESNGTLENGNSSTTESISLTNGSNYELNNDIKSDHNGSKYQKSTKMTVDLKEGRYNHLDIPNKASLLGMYEVDPQPKKSLSECFILLTIKLQSNGLPLACNRESKRSVEGNIGLPFIYMAALQWLLTLVPQPNSLPSDASPFLVCGMQQMKWNKQLCLCVGVKENKSYLRTKSRIKHRGNGSESRFQVFAKQVSHFLATNTFKTACPWLEEINKTYARYWKSDRTHLSLNGEPQPLSALQYSKPLSSLIEMSHDPTIVQKISEMDMAFPFETVDLGDAVPYVTVPAQKLNDFVLIHKIDEFSHVMNFSQKLRNIVIFGFEISALRLGYVSCSQEYQGYVNQEPIQTVMLFMVLHGPSTDIHERLKWNVDYNGFRSSEEIHLPDIDVYSLIKKIQDGPKKDCETMNKLFNRTTPEEQGQEITSSTDEEVPINVITVTSSTATAALLFLSVGSDYAILPLLLMTIQEMGFSIQAVNYINFNEESKALLKIRSSVKPYGITLVFLLVRENCTFHLPALKDLLYHHILLLGASKIQTAKEPTMDCFVLTVPYTHAIQNTLNQVFPLIPKPQFPNIFYNYSDKFYRKDEFLTVVIMISTPAAMQLMGPILNKLSKMQDTYLVAYKVIPQLQQAQAYEITPYTVGTENWWRSMHNLAMRPLASAILIGENVDKVVKELIDTIPDDLDQDVLEEIKHDKYYRRLDIFMSNTVEMALHHSSVLFNPDEVVFPVDIAGKRQEYPKSTIEKLQNFCIDIKHHFKENRKIKIKND